jgi:hypothetical protein
VASPFALTGEERESQRAHLAWPRTATLYGRHWDTSFATPHSTFPLGDVRVSGRAYTPSWVHRDTSRPCFGMPPAVATQLHSLSLSTGRVRQAQVAEVGEALEQANVAMRAMREEHEANLEKLGDAVQLLEDKNTLEDVVRQQVCGRLVLCCCDGA